MSFLSATARTRSSGQAVIRIAWFDPTRCWVALQKLLRGGKEPHLQTDGADEIQNATPAACS